MVDWYWIPIVFGGGVFLGGVIMAMMALAGDADRKAGRE